MDSVYEAIPRYFDGNKKCGPQAASP